MKRLLIFMFVITTIFFIKEKNVYAYTEEEIMFNRLLDTNIVDLARGITYQYKILYKLTYLVDPSVKIYRAYALDNICCTHFDEGKIVLKIIENTNLTTCIYEDGEWEGLGWNGRGEGEILNGNIADLPYSFEIVYANFDLYDYSNRSILVIPKYEKYTIQDPDLGFMPKYVQLGLKASYPYYIYAADEEGIRYFIFSKQRFYDNIGSYKIHSSGEVAYMKKIPGQDWSNPIIYSNVVTTLPGHITSSMVLYNNYDILITEVPENSNYVEVAAGATSDVSIERNPIPDLEEYMWKPITFEDIGVPLKVRLYAPPINTAVKDLEFESGLFNNNVYIKNKYALYWENPIGIKGYQVEIQAKGIYNVKRKGLAGINMDYEEYETDWQTVGLYDMNKKAVVIDEEKIDMSENGLLYESLKNKAGYEPNLSNMKKVKLIWRIRYRYGNSETREQYYGYWVQAEVDNNQAFVSVKDDNNETVSKPEYDSIGIDYTNEDIPRDIVQDSNYDSIGNAINNLGDWIGQIPELLGKLFNFLPSEFLAILTIGITLIIILKIFNR